MKNRSTQAGRAGRIAGGILAALATLGAVTGAVAQTTLADPFKDERYMSGFRDVAPPEVPEHLRDASALERIAATKRITACGDPYAYPSTEITDAARGYDVDLFRAVAGASGWEAHFVWVNTSNRGGLNRAFRTTIRKGVCDVFLGLGTGGADDALKRSKLTLMAPSFAAGYTLVTFDSSSQDTSLRDIAASGARVAATYFTPTTDILTQHGIAYESFPEARRAIAAMASGSVQFALVPTTSIAHARRDYPDRPLVVVNGVSLGAEMHWNNAWAVQEKETALREHLEQQIASLAASGEVETILGRYGIPYRPPVAD